VLLAGTATLSVRSYLLRGKQNVARAEVAKICQAIDTFYAEYDRFPTSDEGLEILASDSAKFPEGILTNLPNDPWGNAYEYLNPGRETAYEVV
jgi:general secretion pathway protein G